MFQFTVFVLCGGLYRLEARCFVPFCRILLGIRPNGSRSGPFLVDLELRYSNSKAWTVKFFFVNGEDWEYPAGENMYKDFPVMAI